MGYLTNEKTEKEIFEMKLELLERINKVIFYKTDIEMTEDILEVNLSLQHIQELNFAAQNIIEAKCEFEIETAVRTLESYEREVE